MDILIVNQEKMKLIVGVVVFLQFPNRILNSVTRYPLISKKSAIRFLLYAQAKSVYQQHMYVMDNIIVRINLMNFVVFHMILHQCPNFLCANQDK